MSYPKSDFINDKETTACFSGHRPEKLHFSENYAEELELLKSLIRKEINSAIDLGYKTFITGMAKGVDIWAALEVLQIKKENPDIKLVGISPFRNEKARLKGLDLWNYDLIVNNCERMIYISDDFFRSCFFVRNRFMVDHSSLIIGVVGDTNSGTGNTLKYAEKQGLKISVIDINTVYRSLG